MAFVDLVHLFKEGELIVGHLLEDLDLFGPNGLLQRNDVEVVEVRKVEAQLAGLLDRFRQVVRLQVIVEDDIVANLRNLSFPIGT